MAPVGFEPKYRCAIVPIPCGYPNSGRIQAITAASGG
jgi:hypothetical protein